MKMNRKVKIALLGLLGFATAACSGGKRAAKSPDAPDGGKVEEADSLPAMRLMYGVPPRTFAPRAVTETSAAEQSGRASAEKTEKAEKAEKTGQK